MRCFAGIDPGQTGGIGIVDQAGKFVSAHRWDKKNPRNLFAYIYNIKNMIVSVYIENINLPTTGKGLDGAGAWAGSGNLLINCGIWQGWFGIFFGGNRALRWYVSLEPLFG